MRVSRVVAGTAVRIGATLLVAALGLTGCALPWAASGRPLPLQVQSSLKRSLLAHTLAWDRCWGGQNWTKPGCGAITVRAGQLNVQLASAWGGGVTGIRYRGQQLVDHHDTGRLVQLALRDHCSEAWNPTQGGGASPGGTGVGSPTRQVRIGHTQVQITSQARDWQSDRLTHVFITQDLAIIGKAVVRLQYTVTGKGIATAHLQPTPHCPANEMPAVYVDHRLTSTYTYTGSHPWSGAPLTRIHLPHAHLSARGGGNVTALAHPAERWVARINPANGIGVALFIPKPLPHGNWPVASWFLMHPRPNYIGLHVPLIIRNGTIARETVYLVAGTLSGIRERIYHLRNTLCRAAPAAAHTVKPLYEQLAGNSLPPLCAGPLPAS